MGGDDLSTRSPATTVPEGAGSSGVGGVDSLADVGGKNPRSPVPSNFYFSPILPFDGIRPVYRPEFLDAEEAETLLFEDELVLGIALGGEAKAYPITVLRFREMVNDEVAGIPTLVTW